MITTESVSKKIQDRHRLDLSEVRHIYETVPSSTLAALAERVKGRFHPSNQATYLIMAIVNYTNVCVAKCDYCSFYRAPGHPESYLLTQDQVFAKIDQVLDLGGTMVGLNGGFHPQLHLHDYAYLFDAIRNRYGDRVTFYGMTIAEFIFACRISRISFQDGASLLARFGSSWVTGGGAEVLVDSFRSRHSPGKFRVSHFYQAQKAILEAGLGSTATMVIGFDETDDERFAHLETLRNFQDETEGGLASFLCWTYKPYHNELGGAEIDTETYLRWLAICRIYLDNFKHIRTSVLTKNEGALEGLKFGANDFDLPTEDEVTEKAGATISLDFENLLAEVRRLGITPVLRQPFHKDESKDVVLARASAMQVSAQSCEIEPTNLPFA